ncbi:MAG: TfoX/Sxy family protein [bacterium]
MREFVEFLHEVFEAFGTITARKMFGGYGIYHDGVMFALVEQDTLYLKADETTRHHFELRGLPRFQYMKKGKVIFLSYYMAPEEIYDDREEAAVWATRSYEAAQKIKRR